MAVLDCQFTNHEVSPLPPFRRGRGRKKVGRQIRFYGICIYIQNMGRPRKVPGLYGIIYVPPPSHSRPGDVGNLRGKDLKYELRLKIYGKRPLAVAVSHFIMHLEDEGKSPNTLRAYGYVLKSFTPYFPPLAEKTGKAGDTARAAFAKLKGAVGLGRDVRTKSSKYSPNVFGETRRVDQMTVELSASDFLAWLDSHRVKSTKYNGFARSKDPKKERVDPRLDPGVDVEGSMKKKKSSLKFYVAVVSSFLNFVGIDELMALRPEFKINRGIPPTLTNDEIDQFIRWVDLRGTFPKKGVVTKKAFLLYLRLAFTVGARPDEIMRLTPDDVFPEKEAVVFKMTKTGRDRIVFAGKKLLTELKEYLIPPPPDKLRDPEKPYLPWGFDYTSVYNKFRELSRVYRDVYGHKEIPVLKPYVCRYSAGTNLEEAGMPLKAVSDILGNSPETCIKHYVSTRRSDLKSMMKKYSGRF